MSWSGGRIAPPGPRWSRRPTRGSRTISSLAVQMGSELGLRPMQSLQNIATINGRPAVWVTPCWRCACSTPLSRRDRADRRRRRRPHRVLHRAAPRRPREGRQFSIADAKRAGLLNKSGPWTQYPDRMLQMRARGFALRDAFPDKLRGLIGAEEASDYTLESAGISAAPPVAEAPTEPPRRTLGSSWTNWKPTCAPPPPTRPCWRWWSIPTPAGRRTRPATAWPSAWLA